MLVWLAGIEEADAVKHGSRPVININMDAGEKIIAIFGKTIGPLGGNGGENLLVSVNRPLKDSCSLDIILFV
jgi:hypothetical protein